MYKPLNLPTPKSPEQIITAPLDLLNLDVPSTGNQPGTQNGAMITESNGTGVNQPDEGCDQLSIAP